ncbi:hypothetical protein As57867_017645, partial [Aphanomyces stellatus]
MLIEFDHALFQLCKLVHEDGATATRFELSPAQTQFIETVSFGPRSPLPYELLHHAFEERAKQHPDVRAIEFEGAGLTYGELNDLANTLAAALCAMGVGVGCRVAVIMDRCLEFPLGLLAVLKVGAAIMPLDASFPINRLEFMLRDANASAVVTTTFHQERMDEMGLALDVVGIDVADLAKTSPSKVVCDFATGSDEAFIVYTSGSTGNPKGIPVTHAGAVNAVQSWSKEAGIGDGLRVLQFMAIGFDACMWETWGSLSHGSCLVFRGQDIEAAIAIADVLMCTPTGLQHLGHPSLYPNLRFVIAAGEPCPTSLKTLWASTVEMINVYGPSECAILTHLSVLTPTTAVSVGKPISNVKSYILDNQQNHVPIGVIGEIYSSGICVSPGYINLPSQTEERFIPDPFVGGSQMMFRTGDLGRILPNGKFEVLGRKDNQVKLKGY